MPHWDRHAFSSPLLLEAWVLALERELFSDLPWLVLQSPRLVVLTLDRVACGCFSHCMERGKMLLLKQVCDSANIELPLVEQLREAQTQIYMTLAKLVPGNGCQERVLGPPSEIPRSQGSQKSMPAGAALVCSEKAVQLYKRQGGSQQSPEQSDLCFSQQCHQRSPS